MGGRFLRENVFLAAAMALPVLVVGLFLAATAVPRWLVAPPAHDLLFSAHGAYDQSRPRVAVEFVVRDGRVSAVARGLGPETYVQVPRLYVVEHQTMNVREIPFELPAGLTEGGPPATIPIDMGGRRVIAESKSPDGWELSARTPGSAGVAGELFGMRSYRTEAALIKDGRVEAIALPAGTSAYSVSAVGWVVSAELR